MKQIRVGKFWTSAHDLGHALHGRREDPEGAADCADYVFSSHRRETRDLEPGTDNRKVLRALISATMQRSIAQRDDRIELRLAEQEVRLKRQAAAIDHLLTFLPKRAKALSDTRLEELRESLRRRASQLSGVDVQVKIEPEMDLETRACHRLVVQVAGLSQPRTLALEDELTEWLFTTASASESPALTLVVAVRR